MGDFLRIKLIDAAQRNDLEDLEFCLNIGDIDVNWVNKVSQLFINTPPAVLSVSFS